MTNVSGPFDSAIEATTRFATESTFDKLNELKFDAVKKHIKLPKSPEGFMKKLAFIGFGIKAGFVPFHNWLPDAHPAAPSHVSGIMSGVMIKTGIYGILRFLLLIGIPSKSITYFVLAISV